MKMSKQLKTGMQFLSGNPDYEHLIQERLAVALKSDEFIRRMSTFKSINFKLNLCIGLMALKLLLAVGGVF